MSNPQDQDKSYDDQFDISSKNEKLITILHNLLEIALIHEVQFYMKKQFSGCPDFSHELRGSISSMLMSNTQEPVQK